MTRTDVNKKMGKIRGNLRILYLCSFHHEIVARGSCKEENKNKRKSIRNCRRSSKKAGKRGKIATQGKFEG